MKPLRTATATLTTLVCSLALTVLGTTATASATPAEITCEPGSQTDTFTPPLTRTPQDVTVGITARYGPCVSSSDPDLTSATAAFTVPVPGLSCLSLLNTGTMTYDITWNTGETSTISADYTVTIAGGVLTVTRTGTITSGPFTGSTVRQVIKGLSLDVLLCTLGQGTVSSTHSTTTLEITSA